MSDYDPTNNDKPSVSVFGANPRYILVPLIALIIIGVFFGIAWLAGNFAVAAVI